MQNNHQSNELYHNHTELFGQHDKTSCWLNGLSYVNDGLSGINDDGLPPTSGAFAKDADDETEGGIIRTLAIALGIGIVVGGVTYLITKKDD